MNENNKQLAKLPGTDNRSEQYIEFKSAGNSFAVSIHLVSEITRMMPIVKTPNSPAFIEGVMELRSDFIAVIDMRKRFSYPETEHNNDARIIIVKLENISVGFIVDSVVMPVMKISPNSIKTPPKFIAGIRAKYISGITNIDGSTVIILNLTQLLSDTEREVLVNAV